MDANYYPQNVVEVPLLNLCSKQKVTLDEFTEGVTHVTDLNIVSHEHWMDACAVYEKNMQ
jgi:hypothetical protein